MRFDTSPICWPASAEAASRQGSEWGLCPQPAPSTPCCLLRLCRPLPATARSARCSKSSASEAGLRGSLLPRADDRTRAGAAAAGAHTKAKTASNRNQPNTALKTSSSQLPHCANVKCRYFGQPSVWGHFTLQNTTCSYFELLLFNFGSQFITLQCVLIK